MRFLRQGQRNGKPEGPVFVDGFDRCCHRPILPPPTFLCKRCSRCQGSRNAKAVVVGFDTSVPAVVWDFVRSNRALLQPKPAGAAARTKVLLVGAPRCPACASKTGWIEERSAQNPVV